MKISPRELREAQIPSKAFGFNQDVVDALLERAADTIEGLIEENRQLFEALERLRNEGTSAPLSDPFADVEMQNEVPAAETQVVAPASDFEPGEQIRNTEKEDLINKTLLLAQRTADETLKTAKTQAEEFVEIAKAKADELVKQATEDAQTTTGQAQEQAQRDLENAQQQAAQLVSTAQTQADELVAQAQAQADSIYASERDKFVTLVEKLTAERAQLMSDISILQTFDHEHRTRLRAIVEADLQQLVDREHLDIGSLPELPDVSQLIATSSPTPTAQFVAAPEGEVVAHSEMAAPAPAPAPAPEPMPAPAPAPATFDEMIATEDIIEPASQADADEDILVSEGHVIESYESQSYVPPAGGAQSDGDPFASFVDAPSVVEPAGTYDPGAQVVEPAGGQVESSGSSGTFDPGVQSKPHHEKLDDDDFFASLREAVQDDAPLGPSDNDEDDGTSKGLFNT